MKARIITLIAAAIGALAVAGGALAAPHQSTVRGWSHASGAKTWTVKPWAVKGWSIKSWSVKGWDYTRPGNVRGWQIKAWAVKPNPSGARGSYEPLRAKPNPTSARGSYDPTRLKPNPSCIRGAASQAT